jgi:hypothetical protein
VSSGAPLLPLALQVPALAILVAFLAWVIRLIRAQRLSLGDSLLWLLSTIAALVVTAFPELLAHGAALFGIQIPANAVFAVGLLYLGLNVLSVTLLASTNAAQVRRLAQECALLRADVERLSRAMPAEADAGDASDAAHRDETAQRR